MCKNLNPFCWLFFKKKIKKMNKICFVCPTITGLKFT